MTAVELDMVFDLNEISFSGHCPVWYPARLSDGRAIDDQFPIGQWPLK
ncbi:tetrathionate reductase subunit A, partial [Salmonella enterica subsp. enterica serovar Heidelberg str. CFSAN002075]